MSCLEKIRGILVCSHIIGRFKITRQNPRSHKVAMIASQNIGGARITSGASASGSIRAARTVYMFIDCTNCSMKSLGQEHNDRRCLRRE